MSTLASSTLRSFQEDESSNLQVLFFCLGFGGGKLVGGFCSCGPHCHGVLEPSGHKLQEDSESDRTSVKSIMTTKVDGS